MEEIKNPAPGQEQLAPQAPAAEVTPSNDGGDAGKGDPLDAITDLPSAIAEAKKYRGIATRHAEKPAQAAQASDPAASEYVTKRDLQLANEKQAERAIRAAGEEFDQNYEAIKALYVNRRGSATPEDILEDLKDAHVVWKSRQPAAQGDQGAGLATITVPSPSGKGPVAPAAKSGADDPRFSGPTTPDQWYPKKTQ